MTESGNESAPSGARIPEQPVQLLGYGGPSFARPGILTAIGVLSIVIGSLSALFSFGGIISAGVLFMMPRMAHANVVTSPTVTTSGNATTMFVVAGPATAPANPAAPQPPAFPKTSPWASGADAFGELFNLALAILLLVTGILTTMNKPVALRFHYWFIRLKIPVCIFASLAYGWMMSQFVGAFGNATNSNLSLVLFAAYAGWGILLGCAYPVGLWIALRSRSVLAYYNSVA